MMNVYSRSGNIINRKFYQFLVPTVLSTIAASLNEFVDGIVVSQLLGSDAMSMVGMASPVMFLFSFIFCLLGVGGSVVYAEFAGRQQQKTADRTFSVVFFISVAVSIAVTVAGIVFIDALAPVLCRDRAVMSDFKPLLFVLILSGILIIPVQVLISFFPAFAKPGIGTAINMIANGVNLLMDYVIIRFFNTGVWGAAMATLVGYAVSALVVIVLWMMKKVVIPICTVGIKDLRLFIESVGRGMGSSINQLGYLIKVSFCNSLSMSLAGMAGVTVFTLCMQSVSIVSIALGGIIGAMIPIASALRGQRDFSGVRILMKRSVVLLVWASLAFFAIFEIWPQIFLYLYNYTGSDTKGAITGIRIFSAIFLFRGFVVLFMYYFQVISRKVYASVISIIDGFAGIVPLSLIFTSLYGINGLWIAFPVLSLIMLVCILAVNIMISSRSCGKYEGFLMLEREDENIRVYDATVPLSSGEISKVVETLQHFCNEHIPDSKRSAVIALAFEEMLSYILSESRENMTKVADVLLKIGPGNVLMDVRSIGDPLDVTCAPSDEYSNIDVLKKVASSIEYNYVCGMNQTRINL